jgi:hypothetical protein
MVFYRFVKQALSLYLQLCPQFQVPLFIYFKSQFQVSSLHTNGKQQKKKKKVPNLKKAESFGF